ncbi:low molecular weight phosphatase family protein [Compostimonas suwonensis]|uniref:Protein-tyrosine phosphatase n=1 Tax=Compostimonas suwonensis TaxID=1048394 RepID=A0A2M9BC72_9MICO|nr:low molecular weight phosphatase family protein [Compostimonas suwonensis]PJJ55565.1 protein-tyrosine phosphatase [Compostimonas suwonensis]
MSLGFVESARFAILVVCTGNICRSPLAAQLLRARLAAAGVSASIGSAGTFAHVGSSMTDEAAALSLHYGGLPSGHTARQLDVAAVRDADLVLTATREHRSEVVSLLPRASRKTFTLRQFARIVDQLHAEQHVFPIASSDDVDASLRMIVDEVAASRGFAPPLDDPADDDVVDPYRQSQAVYDQAGASIDRAVTSIVRALAVSTEVH